MVDETRRKILKTGAAAAAMAAVPPVLAQQNNQAAPAGKFYERGKVRIHYEEQGKGFPLMLIAGVALVPGKAVAQTKVLLAPGAGIHDHEGSFAALWDAKLSA